MRDAISFIVARMFTRYKQAEGEVCREKQMTDSSYARLEYLPESVYYSLGVVSVAGAFIRCF